MPGWPHWGPHVGPREVKEERPMRWSRLVRSRGQMVTAAGTVLVAMAGQALVTSPVASADTSTVSPIKHVIVIIGENHSFDNVFATYQPPKGETVDNLLSEGIINADGSPGPNYAKAEQAYASNTVSYSIKPQITGTYATLPQPNTTSATGLPPNVPDARFPPNLPDGPYQITDYTEYQNDYVGDPIHRFYQMWQQMDEGIINADGSPGPATPLAMTTVPTRPPRSTRAGSRWASTTCRPATPRS
ncbi:MAG: alkaline phosphatase family protein [Actinomycetota bacterium]